MAKRKLTKTGNMILTVLMIASLGMAGFSAWKIFEGMQEYNQGTEAYTEVTDAAVIETDDGEETIDFEALRQINPDIAAWIRLTDSAVDYPVVYGHTKPYGWYLTHLFNGEENNSGCIYLDEGEGGTLTGKNLVFYGHHMRNGTMFADIEKYGSQEWYSTHKEIELITPEGTYLILPAAGIFTTGTDAYIRMTFADDADFLAYIQSFTARSTFVSDTVIEPSDQIALLSTCSYNTENGRYALIGKVIRADDGR